ncbi:DNA-binding response regulator [Nocardioides sp.]|jgi:DNA-binding CsgD family transcriptional regulator|uniref:DNA-binding response regulator n=1 Tax=Nocardioides sp. TaxID=35761 RepID=UPI0031FEEAC2|nr:Helix-turn-helix, type 11 domain protein [Nocardioides sp.]
MPRKPASTLLTSLGFSRSVERIYERLISQSGRELVSVAETLLRSPDELLADVEPLRAEGIVWLEGSRMYVAPPVDAIAMLLATQAEQAARSRDRLAELSHAIPFLAAGSVGPGPGEVHDVAPIDGELSSGGSVFGLLHALITQSKGDLLWLRPDQWRISREESITKVVGEVIASGRTSRAIYPLQALREAPKTLLARAEIGEQVRVLPDLPTRLLIVGRSHALLPEPLGFADEPRTLVRQPGLVEALSLWFELLWERAAPVPSVDRGDPRPDLHRFLLQQLASGAQDEQIARRLGVSLRTVRRRVADTLSELGADTRFQAGVEAVRRGWL